MRGMAFELDGKDVERDFVRAEKNYRKAATFTPDAITFLYLARVIMKQGEERHPDALRYIEEAASIRMDPEVSLAYVMYY